jgi:hypothetical protein
MHEEKPWPEEWCHWYDSEEAPLPEIREEMIAHLRRQSIIDQIKQDCGIS